MRSLRSCLPALALLVVGCGGSDAPPREAVVRAAGGIAYGSTDTLHTAVVAVLAPESSPYLQECTGSIVKVDVAAGQGYVLTAAHCCNQYVPNVVVAANDYAPSDGYVFGGIPQAPAYPVVRGSVWYDAAFGPTQAYGIVHDFCMLRFSGATSSTPVLALPPASGDGLSLGASVEHIGFGETDSGGNSTRITGTDAVNLELAPPVFQYGQGGSGHVPGTCAGDSGGPALFPAGVAQAQQTVVGVTSYGNNTTCAQVTYGGAMRVVSEMGPGGFISSYLAGTPTGVQMGGTVASAPASTDAGRIALAVALLVAGLAGTSVRRGGRRAVLGAHRPSPG
jgi:hypothetical protein